MSIKKNKKSNVIMIISVLVTSLITLALFGFNIINIMSKTSKTDGFTLEVDKNSSISNSKYVIGNNPTELLRENFKLLTSAINDKDPYLIAEYVAKCFVIDHFTWTNKDGNYEVGGLQYVYGPKFTSFAEESRYKFYSDLDLYISQYGRENLLEVDSVTGGPALDASSSYVIGDKEYKAYYIELEWTYKKSSKINVDDFQNIGYMTIIDNDGRFEVVSIYDGWDTGEES